MSIRRKTVFLLFSVLGILAGIILGMAWSIFNRNALHNEQEQILHSLHGVLSAIQNDIAYLDRTTVDYASWDATYAFAHDNNADFITDNFVADTFSKNRFGLVVIANTNGMILFKRLFDLQAGQEIPFPDNIKHVLGDELDLFHHDRPDSSLSGLVENPDGALYMIASRPILTGHYEGPIGGAMIIGRPFDIHEVHRLAELVNLPLQALAYTDPDVPAGLAAAPRQAPYSIRRINRSTIAGYLVLRDLAGHPVTALRFSMPRAHYTQAIESFLLFAIALASLILTAAGLVWYMFNRLILSRLGILHQFVRAVGASRPLTENRLTLYGDDEIATLGHAFNHMLDRIESAVTAKENVQTALSEKERVLHTLLGNLKGMAYRCENNPDWTLLFASDGCLELTGYTVNELCDSTKNRYNELIEPEDRDSVWRQVQEALRKKRPYQMTYRIRDKAGKIKWVWEQGCGIFDDQGNLLFLEGFNTDITQYQEAEERHKKLERQILHSQKLESLGMMAGGIAHDFNNMLMVVLGTADMLLHDAPPESPIRTGLKDITTTARQAADLCRQLLAYSGKGHFVIKPVHISRLIEETKPMLAVLVPKKIGLEYQLEQDLPATHADASQVRQTIMNLVLNAAEAIGDNTGSISIQTGSGYFDPSQFEDGAPNNACPAGRYVFMEVTDSGCGMDAATITHIFDPFFTTKFTGRGLGLSAVLGIAQSHRGWLRVNSRIGKGTTFLIYLPASEKSIPVPQSGATPANAWHGQGTLLVVDDENTIRKAACRMVQQIGFKVREAADGEEAVRIFTETPDQYAGILLDLTMPKMDGTEVLARIRQIHATIPVILSSGYEWTASLGQDPCRAFIQKPYTADELRIILQRLISPDTSRKTPPPGK